MLKPVEIDRIRKAMKAKGLTQQDLARRCGVCRNSVVSVLTGKNVSLSSLRKILHGLGLQIVIVEIGTAPRPQTCPWLPLKPKGEDK